jgi:surface carbohydrate biosynthesis protein
MIKIFFKKIKKLYTLKIFFHLPKIKSILLYDEVHSLILKEIIKKDFNILKTRELEIYFWIVLKQIILFDFKFSTYCKNYIKFTKPKVVVTFNDRKLKFYELKDSFKNINFISIQNGLHDENFFKKYIFNKCKCDYFFIFNKHYIQSYKKYIKSKYIVFGNFKNNLIKINKSKKSNDFLLISEFDETNDNIMDFHKKLLGLINLYFLNSNKKIHILLRRKDHKVINEINFFKKIFKSNCVFHKSNYWKKSYKILDKYENIIFVRSALGYESIARKKKIAVFPPNKIGNYKYWFGWPAPPQKSYNFFTAKKYSYNEIKRVLNNIKNCSQTNWNKKYFSAIKDQFYLNRNNTKLKNVIFKCLN